MSPSLRLPARAALLPRSPPETGVPRAPPVPPAASARPRGSPEPSRPRGLAEMPGPSSAAFIFELLCRGGVRRLHEMQVQKWGGGHRDPRGLSRGSERRGGHSRCHSPGRRGQRESRGDRGDRGAPGRGSGHGHGSPSPGLGGGAGTPGVGTVRAAPARGERRQRGRGQPRVGGGTETGGTAAISWVLFSCRLGCLGDTGDTGEGSGDTGDTEAVIRSVGAVLALTLVTMALPRPLLRLLPAPWHAFCHAWDRLFAFAKGHVDRRVAEVAARGPLAEGDTCVTDLLARERVPISSIYGNVTELLLAGVDTVASTLAWSLYELARNPRAQAALHRELAAAAATGGVTGGDGATTDGDSGVTCRLYPVIPANARVVPDRDIRVGDYLVPRQTLITLCHYTTSRDSRFFPAPDTFLPERWLRHRDTGDTAGDTPGDTPGDIPGDTPGPGHPFASLPFGLGPRSCVGRRLAELQLHMALAQVGVRCPLGVPRCPHGVTHPSPLPQILLRFEVRPEPGGGRVRPMTRTLLAPGAPISLRFLER
uniref:25-hydroxyvitamin D-1 alpha hydroxylase, mitochondrial n=1 Tax=Lonchura striata TaxID=40157 RepID=UPI000B4DEDB1|nr:25-hydroxyvitamin D-1 alpha hydroxylase, mitochondrial [Lonchura striata domestica]